jgi:hypothetical protein
MCVYVCTLAHTYHMYIFTCLLWCLERDPSGLALGLDVVRSLVRMYVFDAAQAADRWTDNQH